jgi:hypothetical protein
VEKEPEFINIIEGPTPEFMPSPYWLQTVYEGPFDQEVAICELRTATGEDIMERCQQAWREGRPVKLDFPDEMRMRQQLDVVAMRLGEVDEGQLLRLWVSFPVEYDDEEEEEEMDEGDEDDNGFF